MENLSNNNEGYEGPSVYQNGGDGLEEKVSHIAGNDELRDEKTPEENDRPIDEELEPYVSKNCDSNLEEVDSASSKRKERKPSKSKWKQAAKIVGGVATGMVLSQLRGSTAEANALNLAEQNNSEEKSPPAREQHFESTSEENDGQTEFKIGQKGGSGLDEDGFLREEGDGPVESQDNSIWHEAMDSIEKAMGPDYSRTDLKITEPGYFTVPEEWEIFSCNVFGEQIANYHRLSYDNEDEIILIHGGPQGLERINGGNFISIPFDMYTKIENPQEGIECTFFSYTPKPEN
jgi:hypothetical protein